MRVIPIPVLQDNYAYLVTDKRRQGFVVDPVNPTAVLTRARAEGITVSHCLTTHHHWDHAGGNEELVKLVPNICVVGGKADCVAACTWPVAHGDVLKVGQLNVRCLETPYHTGGHICYLCEEEGSSDSAVFTGDSLFVGGCGRCFAGTYEQMYHSLINVLAKLPPETAVYCGHEYTVSNLQFCLKQDGNNVALKSKLSWALHQREQGLPTVPSSIKEELQYNVFLRCTSQEMMSATYTSTAIEALRVLRQRKDNNTWVSAAITAVLNFLKFIPPLARRMGVDR